MPSPDAVKVIVVGNGSVGKSSLVKRYCKGEFTSEYKKTIGADFLEKDVFCKVCLQLGVGANGYFLALAAQRSSHSRGFLFVPERRCTKIWG